MKKLISIVLVLTLCLALFTGCRESTKVSYNVSKEADNFNVNRRITVLNVRTNTVLYELTGNFSLKNSAENEITVISEVAAGEYKKDFIYLNEWTTYIVQDVSGAEVDQYRYEVNILPQAIGGVSITMND